jgi:hypothetical protein
LTISVPMTVLPLPVGDTSNTFSPAASCRPGFRDHVGLETVIGGHGNTRSGCTEIGRGFCVPGDLTVRSTAFSVPAEIAARMRPTNFSWKAPSSCRE